MSLLKEIISKSGAVAKYHRIEAIEKNADNLIITISDYASQEYRDKEKQYLTMLKEQNEKVLKHSQLTAIPEKDLTQEQLQDLKEVNEWIETFYSLSSVRDFYLFKTKIELEWTSDTVSFEEIYTELKTNEEMFFNAVDC